MTSKFLKFPVDPYVKYNGSNAEAAAPKMEYVNQMCEKIESRYQLLASHNRKGSFCFVTGQPGAGKNVLIETRADCRLSGTTMGRFSGPDFLLVDHDDWRELHPDYASSMQRNIWTASLITQPEIDEVERRIVKHLLTNGQSIILSDGAFGVLKRTNMYLDLANAMDYEVHLISVAMDLKMSEVNVRLRFERMLKKGLFPRWVPHSEQKGVYLNIIECLRQLSLDRFTSITIVGRNHDLIFRSTDGKCEKAHILNCIECERGRRYSAREKKLYLDKWGEILSLVKARGCGRSEIDLLEKIIRAASKN